MDDISFSVMPGEILGLLGLNGAGKTTTINMVLGVLEPTSGTILIEGCDLASQRSRALARTNFSAVYAPLPGNLTVEQNLRIFGMLYDVPALSGRIEAMLATSISCVFAARNAAFSLPASRPVFRSPRRC